MPIFFVDNDILKTKLECIVCPIKVNDFLKEETVCNQIYNYAGSATIEHLFDLNKPKGYGIPVITDGANLAKRIIHVIVPDLIKSPTFKIDMYFSYNDIFKFIIKGNFQNVVFPPLYFSYKRLGNMNSYRTCKTFLKYFMNLYKTNFAAYIMVDKTTINDHLNNYVSTYESTSYPLSKRHKSTVYPLNNDCELRDFINQNDDILPTHYNLIKENDYHINVENQPFLRLYQIIKEQYKDDYSFCYEANITNEEYKKIFTEIGYIPNKYIMIPICIAAKMNIERINHFLETFLNDKLNENNATDKIIIECLNNNIYDILTINERLYVNNAIQLGDDKSISNSLKDNFSHVVL